MKLLAIVSLFAMTAVTHAAEAWAYGVSRESGWVDYDKDSAEAEPMADTSMCWAAAASNVITWWQNQNAELLTSTTLPDEDPWEVSRLIYMNVGGFPSMAFNWWINGVSFDELKASWAIYDKDVFDDTKGDKSYQDYFYGGFLKSVYSTAENPVVLTYANNDSYAMCQLVVDALESGYALTLNTSGHALTLWGVEYEKNDKGTLITKAWVTDSDDHKNQLVESSGFVVKSVKDGADGEAIAMYLPTYTDGTSFVWGVVSGMRTDIIPEPTTGTLSLLALAALAARRRRHR